MPNSPANRINIALAHDGDRSTLEQLWTMFRHDMSAFSGALPNAEGRFRQERLDNAFDHPGWCSYILRLGGSPVGLAVLRGLDTPDRVINSFFLVHGARRAGHGRAAVHLITQKHPGRWAVAFQDANTPAAAFWRSIAASADPYWTSKHCPVPSRPDLPPDTWIKFDVPVASPIPCSRLLELRALAEAGDRRHTREPQGRAAADDG